MATDRQIEANRRNAKKSTGPKSADGKSASKGNAWKHGLAASTMLFCPRRHEDFADFEEMRHELMDSWQPVGMKETQLVEMIAGAYARMQRNERIESGFMNGALANMQRRFGLPDTPTGEDDFGCGIVAGDEKHQLTFETLDRYRRNAWLDHDRAVRRLEAMQKQRRQMEIDEKEEQLREAQRQEKLAEIRAASTAKPVVFATEDMSSEELASFRENHPSVFVIPFGHQLRRGKRGGVPTYSVVFDPGGVRLTA